MTKTNGNSHLPKDPRQWVKDLEAIWQARDGERASQGFTEDAVQIWGPELRQSGAELFARPAKWFSYAKDLVIYKDYIAHTDNCIVNSWRSVYTHPQTKKRMHERGIECHFFRDGLICEQRVWQHSWVEGENAEGEAFSTD
jgi:hypothetical protein